MRHLKIGTGFAIVAVVLACVSGVIASLDVLVIMKRLPISVLVFGLLGCGISYVLYRYFPELVHELGVKKDHPLSVDITLSEENPHGSQFSIEQEENSIISGVEPFELSSGNQSEHGESVDNLSGKADMGEDEISREKRYSDAAKVAKVIRTVLNREE